MTDPNSKLHTNPNSLLQAGIASALFDIPKVANTVTNTEAVSPPVMLQQTLNVGDIVKARETVQDGDADGTDEGEVPALHVRVSLDRWV